MRRRRSVLCFGLAALAMFAGCAETLPDQDRRIYSATPAAKLSADVLAKDYADDAAAADRQYWGKALEVSGDVTAIAADAPHATLEFAGAGETGVRAEVLDDERASVLEAIKVGDRVTLRCFCAGLDGGVRLKSCVIGSSSHRVMGPSG